KATKKFQKNHLKETLDRRRAVKKNYKGKNVGPAKKGGANAQLSVEDLKAEKMREKELEEMSMGDFLAGGFEVPEGQDGVAAEDDGSAEEDDEDMEEDDEEEEETAAPSKKKENKAAQHKQDIEALKSQDPEFYKYLQENDAGLLDFSDAEDDDLANLDSDAEDLDDPSTPSASGAEVVTKAHLKRWRTALVSEHSLKALRRVVLAFRAAAHQGEDNDANKTYKYAIQEPAVFDELMILALTHIPEVVAHHIPAKENGGLDTGGDKAKKYRNLIPLLKSHFGSLGYMLPNLSDPATLKLVLTTTEKLVPYMLSFRKFLRGFLKSVIDIWGTNTHDSVRIAAFLLIRKFCVVGDSTIRDVCLKASYQTLIRASRSTTVHSLPAINLLKNSAAELYGLDLSASYQHAFGFVRQLAVHLRQSITQKSKEAYKGVYNWQYAHSLDFWGLVLGQYAKSPESPLRALVYPLVQVVLGAMRLIPTAQFFPLRFHLIRTLIKLSAATKTYIPLASALFEVLESAELRKKPKPSTLKPLDFGYVVRAPKSYLRTKAYQDGVCDEVAELLVEYYALEAKSIAFPELVVPAIVALKRWTKKSKNAKFNRTIGTIIDKFDMNAKFVTARRANIEFAPENRGEVDNFLKDLAVEKTPLGGYAKVQREVREERRRMIEEAEREESNARAERRDARKKGYGSDEEEESEGEMEVDENESEEE
ncbi:Noc2-domain-containing protein, partial [Saitoella complicata NRRL Y-17804]